MTGLNYEVPYYAEKVSILDYLTKFYRLNTLFESITVEYHYALCTSEEGSGLDLL
jgi:hypothetical protein